MADDAKYLKDKFKVFVESFNKDWLKKLESNWNSFISIYGRSNKRLKSFGEILSKEFGPKFYSVLSCGKVKNVEQKLLVVLQEVNEERKEEELRKGSVKEKISLEKQKKEKSFKTFQIIRMYWL